MPPWCSRRGVDLHSGPRAVKSLNNAARKACIPREGGLSTAVRSGGVERLVV